MTMRVVVNSGLYAVRCRQRAQNVTPALRQRFDALAMEMKAEAVRESSGPYSLDTLRRLGHPYGRAHGFPVGADYPATINVQTGRFRGAWRTRVQVTANGIVLTLSNPSPEARFLTALGTKRMIGRPILDRIAEEFAPRQMKAARAALQQAIGPGVQSSGLAPAFTAGGTNALGVALVGALTGFAGGFSEGYGAAGRFF